MRRPPAPRSVTGRRLKLLCLALAGLALAADAAYPKALALKSGEILAVDSFSIKDNLIEVRVQQDLYSLPVARVDLEKTALLNQQEEQRAGQAKAAPGSSSSKAEAAPALTLAELSRLAAAKKTGNAYITNENLRELVGGTEDPGPVVSAAGPTPEPRKAVEEPSRWKIKEAGRKAELAAKKKELAETDADVKAAAQRLYQLRMEHAEQSRIISYIYVTGGDLNSVGGNVQKKIELEDEMRRIGSELSKLLERQKQLKNEVRWLSGPIG